MPCLSLKHLSRAHATYRSYKRQLRAYRKALYDYETAMMKLDPFFIPSKSLVVLNFETRIRSLQSSLKRFVGATAQVTKKVSHKASAATKPLRAAASQTHARLKTAVSSLSARAKTLKTSRTPKTAAASTPEITTGPLQVSQAAPQKSRATQILRVPHERLARRLAGRPTRADLINAESKLGSTLFGPIPAGHRREFFHDKDNVWLWYEEWQTADSTGEPESHQLTVRYEVERSGVYKKVSAGKYLRLEGDELENFRLAAHAYLRLIKRELYDRHQAIQPRAAA